MEWRLDEGGFGLHHGALALSFQRFAIPQMAAPPSGSAPSGSAPSGSAPSGSAPSGSAVSGSAVSGAPLSAIVDRTPHSLGQLPLAAERPGGFILPLGDDEAVWIGLSWQGQGPWRAWVAAQLGDGRLVNLCKPATLVKPVLHLPGIPVATRRWQVVGRGKAGAALVAALSCRVAQSGQDQTGTATIRLLSPSEAHQIAPHLHPGPLDPKAGYQGLLLP